MTKSEFWRAYVLSVVSGGAPGVEDHHLDDDEGISKWAADSADLALAEHEKRFPGVLTDDPPRDGAGSSLPPYACQQCGSVTACDHVPF